MVARRTVTPKSNVWEVTLTSPTKGCDITGVNPQCLDLCVSVLGVGGRFCQKTWGGSEILQDRPFEFCSEVMWLLSILMNELDCGNPHTHLQLISQTRSPHLWKLSRDHGLELGSTNSDPVALLCMVPSSFRKDDLFGMSSRNPFPGLPFPLQGCLACPPSYLTSRAQKA